MQLLLPFPRSHMPVQALPQSGMLTSTLAAFPKPWPRRNWSSFSHNMAESSPRESWLIKSQVKCFFVLSFLRAQCHQSVSYVPEEQSVNSYLRKRLWIRYRQIFVFRERLLSSQTLKCKMGHLGKQEICTMGTVPATAKLLGKVVKKIQASGL